MPAAIEDSKPAEFMCLQIRGRTSARNIVKFAYEGEPAMVISVDMFLGHRIKLSQGKSAKRAGLTFTIDADCEGVGQISILGSASFFLICAVPILLVGATAKSGSGRSSRSTIPFTRAAGETNDVERSEPMLFAKTGRITADEVPESMRCAIAGLIVYFAK